MRTFLRKTWGAVLVQMVDTRHSFPIFLNTFNEATSCGALVAQLIEQISLVPTSSI